MDKVDSLVAYPLPNIHLLAVMGLGGLAISQGA